MTNIRIGKDITAKWSVLTNGQATSLVDRDLTLELHTPTGSTVQLDYEIDFNVITFTYHGIYHERTGRYTLTLWENRGMIGQSVVDKTDAFCLVNRSELESANINSNLELTTLNLGTSSLDLGQGGSGVGIAYIVQVETSAESDGENVIRFVLTDGTKQDIVIRNGSKGETYTLTDEDKQAIVSAVLEALNGNTEEQPSEPSEDTPEQGSQEGDNQEQTE